MNASAIFWIIVVVLGLYFFTDVFKSDEYVGFYYPNADDLTNDIMSPTFETLDECRDWVDEQNRTFNPDGTGYDYECGLNCDFSGGKPYICEETVR